MNKALIFILCLVLLITGCSDPDEKANELYVEASELYEDGDYRQALEKLAKTVAQEYLQ